MQDIQITLQGKFVLNSRSSASITGIGQKWLFVIREWLFVNCWFVRPWPGQFWLALRECRQARDYSNCIRLNRIKKITNNQ